MGPAPVRVLVSDEPTNAGESRVIDISLDGLRRLRGGEADEQRETGDNGHDSGTSREASLLRHRDDPFALEGLELNSELTSRSPRPRDQVSFRQE